MSPPVRRIETDTSLPEVADVVIIGGGIIGCSATLYLTRRGMRTVLVEKGHIAGEQSSRNWGWVRQQGRAEAEMPLAREALRLWGELQDASPSDLGFRRSGILYVTEAASDMARWEKWEAVARRHGIRSNLLGAEEARAITPGCVTPWIGGLFTESDGRAEPSLAAPGIAEMAREAGAVILQACAARGLETTGGAVSAVVTEKGTIETSQAVFAGGAWARMFCRRHGVDAPVQRIRATAMRTGEAPHVTDGMIGATPFTLRRRLDGGYTLSKRSPLTFELSPDAFRFARLFWPAFRREHRNIKLSFGRPFFEALAAPADWPLDRPSPFESEAARVLDPKPDPDLIRQALRNLGRAYPALADVRIAEAWAGYMDATPDAIPIISSIDKLPGFILAAGSSGHGFGTGPAVGHLIADLVTGAEPIVDPTPFRYSRMIDGTELIPETGF